MSLERELVFELMDQKQDGQYILDVVEGMREQGVSISGRKVEIALTQYNAKKELEKRREYKRKFRDELKELKEKKKREIENTYSELLSVRIIEKRKFFMDNWQKCHNCKKLKINEVYAKIKYVNEKGKIPSSQKEEKTLFRYCRNCGHIDLEKKV